MFVASLVLNLGVAAAPGDANAEQASAINWNGDVLSGFRDALAKEGVKINRDRDGNTKSWGSVKGSQAAIKRASDIQLRFYSGRSRYYYSTPPRKYGEHSKPHSDYYRDHNGVLRYGPHGGLHQGPNRERRVHPETPRYYYGSPYSQRRRYGEHSKPHSDYYRDHDGRLRYGPHGGQHKGPHKSPGFQFYTPNFKFEIH